MRDIAVTAGIAALVVTLSSDPGFADAATRREAARDRTPHSSCVRHKSNNGTAIGAVAGGVLGNVIAGKGSRTGGTILGAGAGAVAGHQIAKKRARSRC
jgi:uncharacterized protein YcfJ